MDEILKTLLSWDAFCHACSGMAGGVTAMSVFYPLDTIRTRLQVAEKGDLDDKQRSTLAKVIHIMQTEGTDKLYKGLRSALISLGCANFVYFYAYNLLKETRKLQLKKRGRKPDIDPISNLLIAMVAGVINVFCTSPLFVVNTRLKMDKKGEYKGTFDCLGKIIKNEGRAGVYGGVVPSLWLVSNPVVQYVTYENVKKWLNALKGKGAEFNSLEFFLMGAIAKAAATVVTYPMQVAQTVLRAQKREKEQGKPAKYKGTLDCLLKIAQEQGSKGLYRGMEAKLLQTVLTAALMFMIYEDVAKIVFRVMGKSKAVKK